MSPSVELTPEVLVGGRYRLVEPLARGGTSSVWRATDARTGHEVAVKVLRDEGVDPALRSRAEREARVLEDLRHPNLVEVLDSGDEDGRPFMVMAMLEGAPLNEIISERGAVPVEEAVTLVADVADGLGIAHDRGVIHRDVKPGNIVCHEQVPTLVDFGIARRIDATTLTRGLVVGTASYLAPEQAQGLVLTPAADVYSLACVLYELLTGKPPFEGDSPVTVALKHVQEEPPPVSDAVDVPAAVNAVVMRSLAKDPAMRPADGTALAAALRESLVVGGGDDTFAMAAIPAVDGTQVMPAIVLPDRDLDLDPGPGPDPDRGLIDPAPLAPPAPHRSLPRIRPAYALAAAAVVLLLFGVTHLGGRPVLAMRSVPDVTNSSVAAATTYLEAAGMHVRTANVASGAPAGTVVGTAPATGQPIAAHGTVTLQVSSGPPSPPPTTTPPAGGHGKHHKGD
ncbi:MAG: eukaryotic-like serine/threonine-protein kinase [Actinomycetota bacterium]|nr:eukaryotic-like serine/threonine-protein kinase [Actinomycetota bacterium]